MKPSELSPIVERHNAAERVIVVRKKTGGKRSKKAAEILAGSPRCIYCAKPGTTVEHMPPRIMFKGKDRPGGMEFPCCASCNNGTRAADAAAGFLSRMDMYGATTGWKFKEAMDPLRTLRTLAPDFLDELFGESTRKGAFLETPGGVLLDVIEITVGPYCQALIRVFAAKLGMALYVEHIGKPLPLTGGVFTMGFLNTGPSPEQAEIFFRILPNIDTLRQGEKKTASGQFDYRYNTDGKGLFAALSHFHGNIHLMTIATAVPDRLALPFGPKFTGFIRPGELLEKMPKARPAIIMPGSNRSPTSRGLLLPKRRSSAK